MNERIKKLAEQSQKIISYTDGGYTANKVLDEEKFALLIVAECLDIVNRQEYSYHEADPLWETAQLIKARFGVK
jgi:acetoin utilization deacetylase AcuC-like enzyme